MKTIQVSEASGTVLDYLVAKAQGFEVEIRTGEQRYADLMASNPDTDLDFAEVIRFGKPRLTYNNPVPGMSLPRFSSCWTQSGPIIDREGILLRPLRRAGHALDGQCLAMYDGGNTGSVVQWIKNKDWRHHYLSGPTSLVAAMRCFVVRKLGDTAEVPDELV